MGGIEEGGRLISRILVKCEICNGVEYARKPYQLPYILTESSDKRFDRISLNVFLYQKHKLLTADLGLRLAFVYRVKTKSAGEIREGVCTPGVANPRPLHLEHFSEI